MELLPQVVMVGMIWFIAVQVIDGNATVGDYSLYTGLLSQISGAILMLVNSVMQVYDNQIKIQNVRSFEDIPKLVLDNGSKELKEVQTISFEQVSFCYPQTENMVLQDVTFTARA